MPMTRPTHSILVGHLSKKPETTAAQTGVMPTAVAASPDPTPIPSAVVTNPSPPTKSSEPMKNPFRHWRPVGAAAPRTCSHTYRMAPAISIRMALPRKGGKPSTM